MPRCLLLRRPRATGFDRRRRRTAEMCAGPRFPEHSRYRSRALPAPARIHYRGSRAWQQDGEPARACTADDRHGRRRGTRPRSPGTAAVLDPRATTSRSASPTPGRNAKTRGDRSATMRSKTTEIVSRSKPATAKPVIAPTIAAATTNWCARANRDPSSSRRLTSQLPSRHHSSCPIRGAFVTMRGGSATLDIEVDHSEVCHSIPLVQRFLALPPSNS